MHPAFESIHKSYAEALRGLSVLEAQTHPEGDPNQWCAQDLIEHLVLTFRSTAGVLEERLLKGRPTQAPVTPEQQARWQSTIMVGRLPLTKAPEPVRPGQLPMGALCGDELVSRLRAEIERLDGLIDRCAEKFGPQPMASHFAFGPLSADQWREFHAVHGRHHLAQMERIRAGIR